VERRGEQVIAVRWRNACGQILWYSKAEACRDLKITPKKLERCLKYDVPVSFDGVRWYLDLLPEEWQED
jgi:hypothetical protein